MTQPDGGQSPYEPPQQPEQGQSAPQQGQPAPQPGSVPGEPAPYQEQTPYQQQPGQYQQQPAPVYAQGAQPYAYGAAPLPKNSLGVWSLVLGILAVLGCGLLTGIAAIITGHKSRKAQRDGEADNGAMGLVGIITGWVGIAWTTIFYTFLIIGVATVSDPAFQEELDQQLEQELDQGQVDPELEELQQQLDELENY